MTVPKLRVIALPQPGNDERVSGDIPDPIRAYAIIGALEDLCRDLTIKRGWDQPHCLGFLYQRERTPVGAAPKLGFDAVMLEFMPLVPSIKPLMEARRPHHVVANMAEVMREGYPELEQLVPAELIAVVLITEAWMLAPKTPEEAKAWDPYRKERRIHEHPERVECRMITAVDVDHVRYGISQARGSSPEHIVGLGAGKPAYHGDVPNSLEYLMWVIQGRTTEDWQTWWRKHYDYRDPEDREGDTWQPS